MVMGLFPFQETQQLCVSDHNIATREMVYTALWGVEVIAWSKLLNG